MLCRAGDCWGLRGLGRGERWRSWIPAGCASLCSGEPAVCPPPPRYLLPAEHTGDGVLAQRHAPGGGSQRGGARWGASIALPSHAAAAGAALPPHILHSCDAPALVSHSLRTPPPRPATLQALPAAPSPSTTERCAVCWARMTARSRRVSLGLGLAWPCLLPLHFVPALAGELCCEGCRRLPATRLPLSPQATFALSSCQTRRCWRGGTGARRPWRRSSALPSRFAACCVRTARTRCDPAGRCVQLPVFCALWASYFVSSAASSRQGGCLLVSAARLFCLPLAAPACRLIGLAACRRRCAAGDAGQGEAQAAAGAGRGAAGAVAGREAQAGAPGGAAVQACDAGAPRRTAP